MDENNTNNYQNFNSNNNLRNDKPKNKFSFQIKMVIGLCVALLVGMLGGAGWKMSNMTTSLGRGRDSEFEKQLAKDTYVNDKPLEKTSVLDDVNLENDVTKVIEENMPSIVSITCQIESQVTNFFGQTYSQVQQGAGSGIIIGEDSNGKKERYFRRY